MLQRPRGILTWAWEARKLARRGGVIRPADFTHFAVEPPDECSWRRKSRPIRAQQWLSHPNRRARPDVGAWPEMARRQDDEGRSMLKPAHLFAFAQDGVAWNEVRAWVPQVQQY